MIIKRGEIYLASLDPVIGKEISKTRPVVVVSNDIGNKFSGTVTVLPLTSQKLDKVYRFEVLIEKGDGKLPKLSKAKADQIRTLDARRLVKKLGKLKPQTIEALNEAIMVQLGLLYGTYMLENFSEDL